MGKRITWESFIERANYRHNFKYKYTKQIFKNGTSKIDIICPEHGNFKQTMESHMSKRGCPICGGSKKHTIDTLIESFNNIHGDKYIYCVGEYVNNESKIKILCVEHGPCDIVIRNHISGQGCKKCSQRVYTTKDYIDICDKLHDGYYTYSKVKYESYKGNIVITCPKHGDFEQNARTHFRGHGCLDCKLSSSELKIKKILKENGINSEYQKKFEGCSYKKKLSFDFYLTDYKTCLEYDGYQHFHSVDFFGGEENLKNQKIRDNIKNEYCLNNGIKLFRINYLDNINEKIKGIINEISL